ncbi:YiiX family permuted papain-like enzyme [Acetonema longum]|uniref:Peptidoglycan peptidase n=1 Tax=Acetonema longum DSM 6540 TaxID=1009370 RepID=F7NDY8_9FIRM|nr:YiiX family permuted papain-like enzyme [Acetonema longum]EGO65742.1 hypothetical protein ALO_01250 [Acetonema longum DSM 6540]
MRKYLIPIGFILLCIIVFLLYPTDYSKFQDGDIIFQISRSSQSAAIQQATHSNYSHMGIICKIKGKYYVYEAIQTVQLTPLESWINRGQNSHFVVKRLKNSNQILTPEILAKMKKAGEAFQGRDYDLYFGWSDDKLYCSELVWKIYYRALGIEIGQLKTLKEFDFNHPIVKSKLTERYGDDIPWSEIVISPGDMFESDLLEKVYSKG